MDWQPYFTTRLVDDFATHLRVFRKAQDRLADREDKQSEHTLTLIISVFCISRPSIHRVLNNYCDDVVKSECGDPFDGLHSNI